MLKKQKKNQKKGIGPKNKLKLIYYYYFNNIKNLLENKYFFY